jgi:tellurite methyltransferase
MGQPGETMPVATTDWDRKYAECPDEWFFGREPSEMARLTLNYWRLLKQDDLGTVLDFGCGEGRDSVFFAGKGFEVTAVDGAASGIQKLRRLQAEKSTQVSRIELTDLRRFQPEAPFDIVLSHNALQFLGHDCLTELSRLREMTSPGGLASIAAFTREAEALAGQQDLYRFDHNELKFYFRDWRLLNYGEYILWREPAQSYLSFAHVLAQKPL